MNSYLSDIKKWMLRNYLKLNVLKTEVLFIARPQDHQMYHDMSLQIQNKLYLSSPDDSVRSLGAYIDGTLTMQKMINEFVSSCYFNLKKLKNIKFSLPTEARLLVVKAFILNKLDFCNILFCCISSRQMQQLEKVMKDAIRFVYNLKKRDSVSASMKMAHFLPVSFRVKYKVCLFAFKILNGLAPSYLNNFVVKAIPSEFNLRSNQDDMKLMELSGTANTKTIKSQMIQYWNCLPYNVRISSSITIFKRNLKTYYFNQAFP